MNTIIVRVLIEREGVKEFNGTAFFINENKLMTAKHVLEEAMNRNYGIYLTELPRGGKLRISYNSIEKCENNDIAIIRVKNRYFIPKQLFTNDLKTGSDIFIRGYHNEEGEINQYPKSISGYTNHEENVYEIGGYIAPGLSGSPVFLDNKICGIARAISRKKNITYIVPITEDCTNSIQQQLIQEREIHEETHIHKMVDRHRFMIILSQRYIQISRYEKTVEMILKKRDDFDIRVLEIGDYDGFDIESEIKEIFHLDRERALERELKKRIKSSDKKFLLIIKDFEHINISIKNRIAKILRYLIEDYRNFYLIIFGGKKLAKLVYENGNTSLFSNANEVILWEEQETNISSELKELTGNHPKLNRLCENVRLESIDEYKHYISNHNITPLIFNNHDQKKLCRYLDEEDLGVYHNVWNNDAFIRDLFWENLLKGYNGRLIWRSEFIRELGKELKCET